MSNSPLVNYTRLSPNCNQPRSSPIKKITIHHMAGNLTVEVCCGLVNVVNYSPTSGMSFNYCIGSDGRIGMAVEEKNRAWTSSSGANDHQAITIEVANDGGSPNWHVSDKAFNALINLCVDICQRNAIEKLNFTGNANGNLTQHNYFSATLCPGPYLKSRFQEIADTVNARLVKTVTPEVPEPPKIETPVSGVTAVLEYAVKMKIKPGAKDLNTGNTYSAWVYNTTLFIKEIRADINRVVFSTVFKGATTGVVKFEDLIIV